MLRAITGNYVLNVTVISWICAQTIKTVLTLLVTGKLQWERMVGAGGMPSAHSAGTVSLTIAIARKVGFQSPEFGIALAFAAIVMYDAMGVRRAAGQQAKMLNKMIVEFSNTPFLERERKKDEPAGPVEKREHPRKGKLKESLGHTPLEVLCGALLGILVALFVPVV